MYDSSSGIEAYIRPYDSDGQYTEYEVPRGSPLYTGNKRERYIEAKTNERYEVVVLLHPEFNFKNKPAVNIRKFIDGGALFEGNALIEEDREPGEPLEDVTRSSTVWVDGNWKSYGFVFDELRIDENSELSEEQEINETLRRGKIEIFVRRGNTKAVHVSDFECERKTSIPPMSTSKKVAMDLGKSHSTKTVDIESKDVDDCFDFFPARGKLREPIQFTFFYTSRMILEMKKIIPENIAPVIAPPSSVVNGPVSPRPNTSTAKRPLSQTVIEIDDDCDDEEVLPNKKIKTELDSIGSNVERVRPMQQTPLIKKIKTEDGESTEQGNSTVGSAGCSATTAVTDGQSAKEKEKAKLKLKLEEIEIKRRLMELDE